MAKDKEKQDTPVIRTDELDLDPHTRYKDLRWKANGMGRQDYEALDDQYKYDATAHKIVSKVAEDATRNGFRIVIPGKPDLQAIYQKGLDDLKAQRVLTDQVIYEYKHGDGYITYLVKETNPTSTYEPLDPDNIENVLALHAFGQKNIDSYRTNDDPTSDEYGKESAIVVNPHETGTKIDRYGTQVPENAKLDPVVIDATRYSHIALDRFDDDETGTSIITRCKRQLNNMSIARETVGKMLREYVFKVFQSDKLMNEGKTEFRRDRDEIAQVANTEAWLFMGTQDKVTKLGTPSSGINDLINFLWQDLSMACNIPKSVLTGEQAGTLSGASQDVVNYYDSVRSLQEQILKPEIMTVVRLLMYSKSFGGGYLDPDSLDWHIEFNPLWSPDDKTQSEILVNHANAAGTLVTNGIFGPDEVAKMFNAQGNNSIQGMQNNSINDETATDSYDIATKYTDEEIEQYKRDLEKAHQDE